MADETHVAHGAGKLSTTTLFVRNLPFTFDSSDLEKVFSDVGPVKRCFVVKDKDNPGKCRGFGYVTFALKDDAEKAKDSVKHISGRKVFLTFSNKKPRHEKRKGERNLDNKGEENNNTLIAENAVDSILDDKQPIIKQQETDEKGKRKPKSQRADKGNTEGRTIVLSGFLPTSNIKQIKKSCRRYGEVEQFIYPVENYENPTAHVVYKSHKESRVACAALNDKTVKGTLLKAVILTKQHKSTTVKSLKKSRLIIRNLSFKCTKGRLKKEFSKFGEVTEVVLPTKGSGKSRKMLGFGFVQFSNVFEAAKALQAMNKKEIEGRPIAVDWTLPKKKYELLKVGENETDIEKQSTLDEDIVQSDADSGEEGDSHEEEDDDVVNKESDEEILEEDSGDESDGEQRGSDGKQSGSDNEVVESGPKKKKLRDAREGKTIFIRNLPFDAEGEEITELFEKFGGVEYCKVVVDEMTEHSRGSAFLKFNDKESAEDCLKACSDDGNEEIVLRKRPLNVVMAVPKGKVAQMLDDKDESKKSPRDKRNLYLAKEGLITPGSQAAEGLSKSDLQKRLKAEAEKKAKLKMPHFIVSKTRLCFRNLPLNVDNKKLAGVLRKVCEGKPKGIGKVQIMRDHERLDGTGTPRSKGFGFVELSTHEDALEILRATNNNPEVFGAERRPMVEFAIENSLILKRQEQRKARDIQKHRLKTTAENPGEKENNRRRKRKRENESESKKPSKQRKSSVQKTTEKVTALDEHAEEANGQTITQERKVKEHTKLQKNKVALQSNKISPKNKLIPKNPSRSRNQRKARLDKEEENFNNIVEKYKSKLFGIDENQIKKSRWFQ